MSRISTQVMSTLEGRADDRDQALHGAACLAFDARFLGDPGDGLWPEDWHLATRLDELSVDPRRAHALELYPIAQQDFARFLAGWRG